MAGNPYEWSGSSLLIYGSGVGRIKALMERKGRRRPWWTMALNTPVGSVTLSRRGLDGRVFCPRSLGSAPGQTAGGHGPGFRAVNRLSVIPFADADQTVTFENQGGVAVPDGVALIKVHAMGQVEKDGVVAAAVVA
jgi:hypothetical protein